ncbi:hypothetical protein [Zavarzinia compransoris]|uniref:Uncharacterized protein n=1 Tax=Zavarzinia compransoris TaxID=1264899 RepID=A0A317DTK7_9PROT|nr:hypothetical protein [Zavarzinia compransoris]PWR18027.1 hypothetical protein DKG75_21040 [Zavarzinia compransoris]TDP43507.1 hypothetical protein DES42_11174 [Zavarzinia compransoris]
MTQEPMTPTQFQTDLDRFGPDLDLWPVPRAVAARHLLAESDDARARQREAATIAAALLAPAPDLAALKTRILAAARASGQALRANVVPFPTRRVVAPAAAALAASLLFGIFAGWTGMIADPLGNSAGGDDAGYEFQALLTGENYDS